MPRVDHARSMGVSGVERRTRGEPVARSGRLRRLACAVLCILSFSHLPTVVDAQVRIELCRALIPHSGWHFISEVMQSAHPPMYLPLRCADILHVHRFLHEWRGLQRELDPVHGIRHHLQNCSSQLGRDDVGVHCAQLHGGRNNDVLKSDRRDGAL